MFQNKSEYDRSVNSFSPEGRLFQVEYAIEAIKLGSTALAIQVAEGVLLAVEKRITSTLLEPASIDKIMQIDTHIGAAMSGLSADGRSLVETARVETTNHRFNYGEAMTVETCTQAICNVCLKFGDSKSKMSRPYGVALLVAGVDEEGPALFHTDPSGAYVRVQVKAVGAASDGAQTALNEEYNKSMRRGEVEDLAAKTLKAVMEDAVTPTNIEFAWVDAGTRVFHAYTPAEVEVILARLAAQPAAE
ncbi:putative Proteasome subunit alpha type-5 [Paratrimastix pyriformis]|uniref:Proteasome subunit alpha type n=1 Tax=Paratrimastix pyriformis TaxID=342808 RepID=A0ABQ8US79_9EUKA|nr:putative Proteasome subunit alpha type-5 [Paratrimastix pyriformis]|eukprot:GAFH01002120.1.p1 GENE.GAFH01002120.1~~GAFH01002120.1.p1  ORF type:complete len:247 (-),score=62.12 GAFH01002120.1:516-1256(-)